MSANDPELKPEKFPSTVRVSDSDIRDLFQSHLVDDVQRVRMAVINDAGFQLALAIQHNTPDGPDKSAAIRLIRQACWTANSAVARGR